MLSFHFRTFPTLDMLPFPDIRWEMPQNMVLLEEIAKLKLGSDLDA